LAKDSSAWLNRCDILSAPEESSCSAVDQNVRTAASLHPPAGKAARTLPEPLEKQVDGAMERMKTFENDA